MNRLWQWLFRQTEIGKMLNGKKTLLGFALFVLAHLIDIAAMAAQLFPQYPAIGALAEFLAQLSGAVTPWMANLGLGLGAVGIIDDKVKRNEEKSGNNSNPNKDNSKGPRVD